MIKIKCIAVDDEPLALKQIVSYIDKTPFLSLEGKFLNALEALTFINNNQIDLIFLDINMPDISGLDFAKSVSGSHSFIFTTAYAEYAIDGFKLEAIDYILKPFSFDEFLRSSLKAQKKISRVTPDVTTINKSFILVKSEYKTIKINLNDILFVEGLKDYVKIHEQETETMTRMTMKAIEEELPSGMFMRVHRSFIVNLEKIRVIERNRIVFGKVYIPVSEMYKDKFQNYLDTGKC